MLLYNKRAVVCGGSDGIGKSCAQLLAKNGASITIIARNESKIQSVIDELDKSNDQSHKFICSDFNKPENLESSLLDELNDNMKALIKSCEILNKVELSLGTFYLIILNSHNY